MTNEQLIIVACYAFTAGTCVAHGLVSAVLAIKEKNRWIAAFSAGCLLIGSVSWWICLDAQERFTGEATVSEQTCEPT
jgi:hypothetical protein